MNKLTFKQIMIIFFRTLVVGLKNTLKIAWFITKIVVPITFIVKLLQHLDLLQYIAFIFEPLMKLFGLPGEAALVILTSNFINIYGGLAVLANLSFTTKQINVLAIMILFSHSMLLETAVIKGLGIPKYKQILVRVGASIFAGIVLNLVIGNSMSEVIVGVGGLTSNYVGFSIESWPLFWLWVKDLFIDFGLASFNSLKPMIVIISFVLIGIEFLKATKVIDHLNNFLHKGTRFLGIRKEATTPLFVGIFVGIVYGAGSIMLSYKNNEMDKKDVLLVSLFLCLAHAIVEDTLLFGNVGANIWIILVGRLGFAILMVSILNKIIIHRKRKLNQQLQTKTDAI